MYHMNLREGVWAKSAFCNCKQAEHIYKDFHYLPSIRIQLA